MTQSLPPIGAMGVKLRVLLLLLSSAVLPAAAQAACSTPTHVRDLTAAMDDAEQAYMDLDLDGFIVASNALQDAIPCMTDAVTPALAARVHATMGLRGFLENDRRESTQAFAAARYADASFRLSATLVPRDAPEWDYYDSVDLSMGAMDKVPAALNGFLSFDGKEGLERPATWPTLVQVFSDTADVLETAYLRPGDAMPAYRRSGSAEVVTATGSPSPDLFKADEDDPFSDVLDDEPIPPPRSTASSSVAPTRATVEDPPERAGSPSSSTTRSSSSSSTASTRLPEPSSRPSGTSRSIPEHSVLDDPPRRAGEGGKGTHGGLIAAVSVSAVATGVAYGLGLNAASQYRKEDTPVEELDGLRLQANIFSGVAGGAGLVLLGTGIALGVSW